MYNGLSIQNYPYAPPVKSLLTYPQSHMMYAGFTPYGLPVMTIALVAIMRSKHVLKKRIQKIDRRIAYIKGKKRRAKLNLRKRQLALRISRLTKRKKGRQWLYPLAARRTWRTVCSRKSRDSASLPFGGFALSSVCRWSARVELNVLFLGTTRATCFPSWCARVNAQGPKAQSRLPSQLDGNRDTRHQENLRDRAESCSPSCQ